MSKNKPKLLFVLHSLTVGGAESLVLQMAKKLESEYQIGILCLDKQGKLWDEASERGYWLENIIRSPGWNLANFLKAKKAISEFKPDIIHAHQYSPFLYSAVSKLLSFSKYKIIFTEHGRHYPDRVSPKRKLANYFLSKLADRVTGVSEFSKFGLEKNEKFIADKIEVIYNGLDYEDLGKVKTISLKEELGLSAATKLIAYVGSLREVKNPFFLLRSFKIIADSLADYHLVYIGEGGLREDLEKEIQNLGLSSRVHLAGLRIPASPYFNEFDMFVQPSFSEACSLALLEAMYWEVPVIVSDGGGGPELVKNNESGFIVPVDNDEELARLILLLAKDKAVSEELVENAKKRVLEKFSFSNMLSGYKSIYAQLS